MTEHFRFAAAVATFGMALRDSEYRASPARSGANATFDLTLELAGSTRGRDEKGYRSEFVDMVRQARGLAVRDP